MLPCHEHVDGMLTRVFTRTCICYIGHTKHTQRASDRPHSPLPRAATRGTSQCVPRSIDMISRRDHAQRPMLTRAKSLAPRTTGPIVHPPGCAHMQRDNRARQRKTAAGKVALQALCTAPRDSYTPPPLNARSTGCAPRSEEQQPVANPIPQPHVWCMHMVATTLRTLAATRYMLG